MAVANTYVEPTTGTALNLARAQFNDSMRAVLTNFKGPTIPTNLKADDTLLTDQQDGMLFRSTVTNALYISDSANKQSGNIGGNFTRWGIGARIEPTLASLTTRAQVANFYETGELVATLDTGRLYIKTATPNAIGSFADVGNPVGYTVGTSSNVTFTGESVAATRFLASSNVGINNPSPAASLHVVGTGIISGTLTGNTITATSYSTPATTYSATSWTSVGPAVHVAARNYTDTSSTSNTVRDFRTSFSIFRPTYSASNSNINVTAASTLHIAGNPIAGANTVFSSSAALLIDQGKMHTILGGTAATPAMSVRNYNTGIYSDSATTLGIAVLGNVAATFDNVGTIAANKTTLSSNGVAGSPTISIGSNLLNGFFAPTTTTISTTGNLEVPGTINSSGMISTTSAVEAGSGSGSVAMTVNDGYGNANLTFNHKNGTPDFTGNSGRISVNTDSTSNAGMALQLKSTTTLGTPLALTTVLYLRETAAEFPGAISAAAITGTTGSFSGDLTVADKIVHSGDTNTSIRFPELDTVTIETNNLERLRVDSSGNVGIGTIPLQRLDVTGNIRSSGQLMSTVETGTAPLTVSSTTIVPNLNADLLDGIDSFDFSRAVCTTALGGTTAANGANTWSKIATYNAGTTAALTCQLILGVTLSGHPSMDTAIISVSFRSNATNANPSISVSIIGRNGTTTQILKDSFKVISGGWNTPMELWVKKGATFGRFSFYEISKNIDGGTLTYSTSPAWQAAEPVGTALNISSDGIVLGLSTTVLDDLFITDKIVHSGDTNTAIRFPELDTVTIETAGSERLRINSTGNIGIGISPLDKLHVAGSAIFEGVFPNIRLVETDTTNLNTRIINETGSLLFQTLTDAGSLVASRIKLDHSTGNVGIGTTAPTEKLHVAGNTTIDGVITSVKSININATYFRKGNVTASISGNTMTVTAVQEGTLSVGDQLYGDLIQPFTRIVALGTGAGGIGTYTVSVSQTMASTVVRATEASEGNLRLASTRTDELTGQPEGKIEFFTNDATPGAGVSAYIGALAEDLSPDTTLVFGTRSAAGGGVDANERMRITSIGNVGIGTSSPTQTLDINANSIRIRTAKTPASATATGTQGEIAWDANYIYVCTATNTWKRTAISTW